jgi:hypothetical protein
VASDSKRAEDPGTDMAEHTHDAARLKPVLLGEMPSERGDEFYMFPLSGQPAVKLLKWAGIKKEEGAAYWTLIEHFHPINAQERHGPKFDLPAASKRWTEYLLRECGEGQEPVAPTREARESGGPTGALRGRRREGARWTCSLMPWRRAP